MLPVDHSRQRGFLNWLLLQSSVKQAAPVHALLYPAIICQNRIMPHSASLCAKGEPPEEMLEILELNPLSNEELWCEQHLMFVLYIINIWCIVNKTWCTGLPKDQKLPSREKQRHPDLCFLGFYSGMKIRLLWTHTENERICCRNSLKSLRNHPYKSLKLRFDKSAFFNIKS